MSEQSARVYLSCIHVNTGKIRQSHEEESSSGCLLATAHCLRPASAIPLPSVQLSKAADTCECLARLLLLCAKPYCVYEQMRAPATGRTVDATATMLSRAPIGRMSAADETKRAAQWSRQL